MEGILLNDTLQSKADQWGLAITDRAFAECMDSEDSLSEFRKLFHYPKNGDLPEVDRTLVDPEEECIYFAGNSLGLMPKCLPGELNEELDKWSKWGVFGYLSGDRPWVTCDQPLKEQFANLLGAKKKELCLMNSLTTNLHLAMISFYKPTKTRHKVLIEGKSFPTCYYCVTSQIRLRGFEPKDSIICVQPREGEYTLRTQDILDVIMEQGHEIAQILLPGIQYYTGQLFDVREITKAAHSKGCMVGFDLAHAIGNVEMLLHNWDVDWAVWCNYKYMNSGPGAIGGLFIHEKHKDKRLHRLTGWFSYKKEKRFDMCNSLSDEDIEDGPQGYQLSCVPMMLSASLRASLQVFSQTSIQELRSKSLVLTGYLENLLLHYFSQQSNCENPYIELLTPSDPKARGNQLSLRFSVPVDGVFQKLIMHGVACDMRKPYVIRLAPAPLYNSFMDVYKFISILRNCMDTKADTS